MATPTQITSASDVLIKQSGAVGPYNCHPVIFESSGGNYYYVGYDSTNGKIGVAKSTTLTGTYSVQDATNAGGGLTGSYTIHPTQFSITAAQDGNTLHIAYCILDNSGMSPVYGVHYEQFSMTNDQYVTTSPGRTNLGTGYDWSAGTTVYNGIAMAIRADGDLIVVHRANDGTSMGGNYARLAYARLEGGTWTTGTSLPFDQAAVHYYMGSGSSAATGGLVFDGGTGRVNIILNRDSSGGNTNYYHYKLDGSNNLTRVGYTGATSYYHGGAGTSMVTTEGDEASYNDGTDNFYFAPGGWGENHSAVKPIITNVQDNPTAFETDYDLFTASTSSYNPDYCFCVIDSSGGTAYLIYDDNNSSASFYTAEYDGYNSFANVDTDTGDDYQAIGHLYYIDCANPTSPGQYRYLCWTTTGHTLYVGTVTAFSSSQNITLTGDITVSVIPASTFATSQKLTGDVTVSVTPASTFAVASTFAGGVPISIAVASDISYGPMLDGDVTVTVVPASTFSTSQTLTGDVTVSVSPASTYAVVSTLTGDVTISVTPASSFQSSQELTGDVAITVNVTSSFATSYVYTSDVSIVVTPASTFETSTELDKFRTSALDFRHANVGIRRTLPPADSSVDADDRATLLREYRYYTAVQNITLDGDVTVSVTPASTFAAQYAPLTGDVTVTVEPASTFVVDSVLAGDVAITLDVASTFQSDSVLSGDVTIDVIPAATFQSSQLLTGDVTVTLSPAATFVVDSVLAGAVEVTVTPSSSFVSSHTYTTDVTVTVTPASSFQVNNEVTLVGDVTVTVAPAASFQNTSTLTGDITVSVIPASTFAVEYAPLTGDVPITVVLGSAFETATTLTGDVTVQVVPGATFSVGHDLTGDTTVLVVPASQFAVEYAQSGDVTITIAPASAFQTGATVVGDVPITVVPASSFAVEYAWTGDVPITVTPSSVMSYTPAGVEFAKYITIVMRDARSTDISMMDDRKLPVDMTDGRSV